MVSAVLRERVRPWIEQQLRAQTDLDASDMAEYVMTLLEINGSREELHQRCVEELREFLGGATEQFVTSLLDEIEKLDAQASAAANQPQQPTQPTQMAPQGMPQNQPNAQAPPTMPAFNFPAPGGPDAIPGFPTFPGFLGGPGGMPNGFPFPMPPNMQFMGQQQQSFRGRGGFRGGRGGGNHFSRLSSVDNELSVANRRLVVEKVPDEKLNEKDLQEYFSQFGNLTRIKIDRSQQLAELEFEGHDQAVKAHSSPAPIFDNRFIKVYWRKADPNDPQEIDIAAVKRMQEQRQQEYKDKEAKRQEYQQKIQELIEKRAALLQDQEKLLKEQATQGASDANTAQITEKQELTSALKQQLEDLKAEATQLGLLGGSTAWRGRGRGRGAPRARGFRGRGAYRGGRGGFGGPGGFGGATLDLRPKGVQVKGVTEDKQEGLMGQLVSSRYSNIDRKDPETVVIEFSDRRSAEEFFNGPKSIPNVGDVEKSWVRTSTAGSGDADMEIA